MSFFKDGAIDKLLSQQLSTPLSSPAIYKISLFLGDFPLIEYEPQINNVFKMIFNFLKILW